MAAVAEPVLLIRAMRHEDLDAVYGMEVVAYPFPWSRGIFADCLQAGYQSKVLMVDGELAGYGVLSCAVEEAHLLNLCTAPGHRGRGHGRYLLLHLLDLAWRQGAREVYLEVRPSNWVAQVLYRSAGFRVIGTRSRYYPAEEGREDAIVMALRSQSITPSPPV